MKNKMGNHPYTMYARRNKFKPDSVVVITGASSGMGKEITYRYAERGCKIVIGSRNLKELTAVAEDCMNKFSYCKVIPVQTDVTIEEDCQRLIETAMAHFS